MERTFLKCKPFSLSLCGRIPRSRLRQLIRIARQGERRKGEIVALAPMPRPRLSVLAGIAGALLLGLAAEIAAAKQGMVHMYVERDQGMVASRVARTQRAENLVDRNAVSVMSVAQPDSDPLGQDVTLTDSLDISAPNSLWVQAGTKYGVPPLLIYAVALVESRAAIGDGQVSPQPWVVRINNHLFTGSREEITDRLQVAQMLTSGIQDVGLMQVHYGIHVEEVRNAVELLDPRTNIFVGTKILAAGLKQTSDPVMGIGYYHSHTPELARPYGTAVLTVYGRLNQLFPELAHAHKHGGMSGHGAAKKGVSQG